MNSASYVRICSVYTLPFSNRFIHPEHSYFPDVYIHIFSMLQRMNVQRDFWHHIYLLFKFFCP